MKERILVRGVNWVGDALMTMPALRAIRRARPEAHITLLVKPWVAPLFERDPNVDEIMLYEDAYRSIGGRLRLAGLLRAREFDTAILLQNAFDAALLAMLAGIPNRIGYSRDARGMLLSNAVPSHGEDRTMHHVDYYLELLRRAGIEAEGSEPWLFLSNEERDVGRRMLANMRRPIVGINPGAAFGSAKQWLPERFAEVAARAVTELGGSAVIFGGPAEADVAEIIVNHAREKSANADAMQSFAGRTTLRELAELISAVDVLVSNDSGPMHMGHALGTPLVALFGSTSPELTGYVGAGARVLRASVKCSPCFRRKCDRPDIPCMHEITADAVMESVKELLPSKKAVFFDRDGTLCVDAHFLNSWDKYEPFRDLPALQELKSAGYELIGVSNQSGIGRGIVDEAFVKDMNAHFIEKHGFLDFYYCTHRPDEGCSCRKPEPALLMRARAEHGVALSRSFVVGDRDSDMLLGRAVGAGSVLVTTGKQRESAHADHVADGLGGAVRYIIGKTDKL